MSSSRRESTAGSGVSLQTLLIASVSSLVAAILVHEVWRGGAIIGAAVTPVIVGIVGEALQRPARKLTAVREVRRADPALPGPDDLPAVSRDRPAEDRFGIWEDQRRPSPARRRAWLRIGAVTGVLGFAAAAFALTGGELVFGGSVTGTSHRTTLLGGRHTSSSSAAPGTTATTTVTRTTTQTTTVPAGTATTGAAPATTVPTDPAATPGVAPPATTTATTPPPVTTPVAPTTTPAP